MKRVLIVDDEQCVLSGLRRQLHARRGEWELVYLEGGQAALDELAARGADVLVTDMRMPGMDGAQLLARVASEHPRVARLVLSGQAEVERQLVARGCCHGYLTKPCPAGQLESAIRQALEVRDSLDALAWGPGCRLWTASPMDEATSELLFRQLADEGAAEKAGPALLALLESDARLAASLALVLGPDTPSGALAAGGARTLVALTLAIVLRERTSGAEDCSTALLAAARALDGLRTLAAGPEPALQAATAVLLALPAPARPGPGWPQALEFLLPIWGFPEAVIASATQACARAVPASAVPPAAPYLTPSPRR